MPVCVTVRVLFVHTDNAEYTQATGNNQRNDDVMIVLGFFRHERMCNI